MESIIEACHSRLFFLEVGFGDFRLINGLPCSLLGLHLLLCCVLLQGFLGARSHLSNEVICVVLGGFRLSLLLRLLLLWLRLRLNLLFLFLFLLLLLRYFLVLFSLSTRRLWRVLWCCLNLFTLPRLSSCLILLHCCSEIILRLFLLSGFILFPSCWSLGLLFFRIFLIWLIFSKGVWSHDLFIFLSSLRHIQSHLALIFSHGLLSTCGWGHNLDFRWVRRWELRILRRLTDT